MLLKVCKLKCMYMRIITHNTIFVNIFIQKSDQNRMANHIGLFVLDFYTDLMFSKSK